MRFIHDPRKDRANRNAHRISLDRASEFDLSSAIIEMDDSQNYGEVREVAIGFLKGNLYVLVFVQVDDDTLRAISLRKATASEKKKYAQY